MQTNRKQEKRTRFYKEGAMHVRESYRSIVGAVQAEHGLSNEDRFIEITERLPDQQVSKELFLLAFQLFALVFEQRAVSYCIRESDHLLEQIGSELSGYVHRLRLWNENENRNIEPEDLAAITLWNFYRVVDTVIAIQAPNSQTAERWFGRGIHEVIWPQRVFTAGKNLRLKFRMALSEVA